MPARDPEPPAVSDPAQEPWTKVQRFAERLIPLKALGEFWRAIQEARAASEGTIQQLREELRILTDECDAQKREIDRLTQEPFRLTQEKAGVLEWLRLSEKREKEAEATCAALRAELEAKGWVCFHCGEIFTDRDDAAEHFGPRLHSEPACAINVSEYRQMEANHLRHCEEDTELHREILGLLSANAVEARKAEETGYARGLKDAGIDETYKKLEAAEVEVTRLTQARDAQTAQIALMAKAARDQSLTDISQALWDEIVTIVRKHEAVLMAEIDRLREAHG